MKKNKIQLQKHALSQKKYKLKQNKIKLDANKDNISKKAYKKAISIVEKSIQAVDSELDEINKLHPRIIKASSLKNLKHYNFVRKNLSKKLKEEGIKLEKGKYNEYAKEINDSTKEIDLRNLNLDFDRVFQEYVQGEEPEMKESLPFYGVVQELIEPSYDDFEIEVNYGEYSFSGKKDDFVDWYTEPDGLRSYLRNNYNDSPTAELVVEEKTDNKIKYRVETHDDTRPPTSREAAAPVFKETDLKKIKQEISIRERELEAERELIAQKRKLKQEEKKASEAEARKIEALTKLAERFPKKSLEQLLKILKSK